MANSLMNVVQTLMSSVVVLSILCLLLSSMSSMVNGYADEGDEEVEKPKSLCDNPTVHAADRADGNTYRVYRDNYFWQLIGLPNAPVELRGPYKLVWKYMGPVDRDTSITTITSGPNKGQTFKFQKTRYWSWKSDGEQVNGGAHGDDIPDAPDGGFDTVLNDGDLDGKGYPLFIGFRGVYVYYYKATPWEPLDSHSRDGWINGRNNESFPADLTAGFVFPSSDTKKSKYYVFLFKGKQYCFRPISGETGCKQWKPNSELFGCTAKKSSPDSGSGGADTQPPPPSTAKPSPDESEINTLPLEYTVTPTANSGQQQQTLGVLSIITGDHRHNYYRQLIINIISLIGIYFLYSKCL